MVYKESATINALIIPCTKYTKHQSIYTNKISALRTHFFSLKFGVESLKCEAEAGADEKKTISIKRIVCKASLLLMNSSNDDSNNPNDFDEPSMSSSSDSIYSSFSSSSTYFSSAKDKYWYGAVSETNSGLATEHTSSPLLSNQMLPCKGEIPIEPKLLIGTKCFL